MTPNETATPVDIPAIAAPARAVRLAPKPVVAPEAVRAAALLRKEEKSAAPVERGSLERKLAGIHDAQEMLRVMSTELALQRTARLHDSGGKSRQAMRVLSITALFALLIAALAAMGWMQSRLAEKGFSRHRAEARSQR